MSQPSAEMYCHCTRSAVSLMISLRVSPGQPCAGGVGRDMPGPTITLTSSGPGFIERIERIWQSEQLSGLHDEAVERLEVVIVLRLVLLSLAVVLAVVPQLCDLTDEPFQLLD